MAKAEEYHSKAIEALEVKEPDVEDYTRLIRDTRYRDYLKAYKIYVASLKRTIEIQSEMFAIAEKEDKATISRYTGVLKLASTAIKGITDQSEFLSDLPKYINEMLDEDNKQV